MEYQYIIKILREFRDQRNWRKYHNLKDLALSANLEASEVLEIFQWKDEQTQLTEGEMNHLKEEIADTLIYLFYMCDKVGMDPYKEITKKMAINQHRHWPEDEK